MGSSLRQSLGVMALYHFSQSRSHFPLLQEQFRNRAAEAGKDITAAERFAVGQDDLFLARAADSDAAVLWNDHPHLARARPMILLHLAKDLRKDIAGGEDLDDKV